MTHWPRPVIQVASLEDSVAYYRDALAFAVDWLDQSGDVPACAQVSRNGVTLILNQNAAFPRASAPSVVSVTLDDSPTAPGLERLHQELVRSGARVTRAPFKVVWDAHVHQMDVGDLDGNVLMFWGHVGAGAGDPI